MITSDNQKTNSLKCHFHSKNNLKWLHIFDTTGDPFCCLQCMRDKELALNDVIHIQEIIQCSEENSFQIMYNYPPTNSSTIQQKLKEIKKLTSEDDLYRQVEQYFTDLQSEFIQALEKAKSQVKKQIIEVAKFKEEFFTKYTEIASILDINQLLSEGKQGMQKKISDILQQKVAEIDKNTQILSNLLLKNESIDNNFSMVHPKQITKNVIALLGRIDFFQGKREQPQNQPLKDNDSQQVQQDGNPGQSSTQILMELIDNPTNYCSKELLSSVQQVFSDLDFYLSQHSFGENLVDQQKRNSFKCLNQEQLEDIRVLSEKIVQISNLQKSNQPANDTANSMDYYPKSQNLLKNLNNISESGFKELTSLLKSYPICELREINFIIPLVIRANMIRSTFKSSSALQVSKNDQNHIVVKSPLPNAHKIAYSDFILDPEKKYIFRAQLSSFMQNPDNHILFGILPDNKKDSDYLQHQQMAYCEKNNGYGMSQMIRGNAVHLGNQQKVDRSLEMRISLKEKILKVSDFPNYENVCQLNDTSRINPSIQYRFGIELYYENATITITDILEVSEFDQRM